jgi:LytS/YehU family sensor histidine kinase
MHFYENVWQLFLVTFVFFLFHASTFYVISYYFLPHFLYKEKYLKFFLGVAVFVMAESTGLATFLFFRFPTMQKSDFDAWIALIPSNIATIVLVTGVLCTIKMIVDKVKMDRAAREREKQQIESELQFLKAQVNPHFLFNAINSVYFLISKNPEQAASTLIKLSDLLRFQLYDCTAERIDIEQEVANLGNFVTLEEIRKGSKTKVVFEAAEDLRGFRVAPFMLVPFLENSFKYVSGFSNKENKIEVKMWREKETFHAHFFNTIDNQKRPSHQGIGHKNVRRRLELIYPERHTLSIVENPGTYQVILTLKIT